MRQYIENFEYKVDLDYSVEADLKSFKEETLNHVYSLYKEHGTSLLLSGGNDSMFILRALKELDITPDIVTFSFNKNTLGNEYKKLYDTCAKFNINKPDLIYINFKEIYEYINYLTDVRNIYYPILHGYVMDYFLNTQSKSKFLSGMGSEYREQEHNRDYLKFAVGPFLVKNNNPNRIFDITSSRTFLSYINTDICKLHYSKPVSYLKMIHNSTPRPNIWYIRDLIYNNCFPDLNLPDKFLGYDVEENNEDYNLTFSLFIKKLKNTNYKPTADYLFNLRQYYSNKTRTQNDY